jgi:hypothetical protein
VSYCFPLFYRPVIDGTTTLVADPGILDNSQTLAVQAEAALITSDAQRYEKTLVLRVWMLPALHYILGCHVRRHMPSFSRVVIHFVRSSPAYPMHDHDLWCTDHQLKPSRRKYYLTDSITLCYYFRMVAIRTLTQSTCKCPS